MCLLQGFFSYVSGTALEVLRLVKDAETESITHGIEINNYRSTLPMGKGLSSSAAICVLVVRAFAAVWGLTLSTEEVMDLAFRGEMRTPSRCGRMDQCVAMGPGKIARMEFDGSKCSLQSISCKTSLHFVVADLNRSKNTIEILRALNSCFPNPKNDTEVWFEADGARFNVLLFYQSQYMLCLAFGARLCYCECEYLTTRAGCGGGRGRVGPRSRYEGGAGPVRQDRGTCNDY